MANLVEAEYAPTDKPNNTDALVKFPPASGKSRAMTAPTFAAIPCRA